MAKAGTLFCELYYRCKHTAINSPIPAQLMFVLGLRINEFHRVKSEHDLLVVVRNVYFVNILVLLYGYIYSYSMTSMR